MSDDEGARYQWIRHITPYLYRLRGQHHALIGDLEKLSPEALQDLHDILRDNEFEISRLRHRYQQFPGGPSIPM